MNKLFKDIRHSDIEAVRAAISKNAAVVNEVYNAKAPKKDIGMNLIKILLENGANPNRKTSSGVLPIGTAVNNAEMILERKEAYPDIQEITKKRLFEVLDLLIKYGADKEEWLNQDFWDVSNKVHYLEEKMYGRDNIDIREPIRIVLKEYFD